MGYYTEKHMFEILDEFAKEQGLCELPDEIDYTRCLGECCLELYYAEIKEIAAQRWLTAEVARA
jgi:hypothetical protein